MPNVMRISEEFLDMQLEKYAGEEVNYCPHGVGQSRTVVAVVGKSFFKTSDINGFATYTRTVDFIIKSSYLDTEPQKGDMILRNGMKYEVFRPNNEPCWRWSGGNHDTYRIHTHAVEEAQA